MLFSLAEILDIVIMTLVIGFIFKDIFKPRQKVTVIPPEHYLSVQKKRFKWEEFWYATALVAPSIILHEFGHKFTALTQGMSASFHASYFGLALGAFLKVISAGFIFFVPAYVSFTGQGSTLQYAGIAFAGPAINLVLWLGSLLVLKNAKLKRGTYRFFFLFSRINMFLFIFNMLPIPGFDGFKVYSGLFSALF